MKGEYDFYKEEMSISLLVAMDHYMPSPMLTSHASIVFNIYKTSMV
jgi:hypothetical protein